MRFPKATTRSHLRHRATASTTCLLAALLTLALLPCQATRAEVTDGFTHPGLLHTAEDLTRIKAAVAAKQSPIFDGYKLLLESKHAKSDYRMQGPSVEWGRAPNVASGQAADDATAAYQNALMWCITREQAHADKAAEILDRWSTTHKRMIGIDGVLAAGLQGIKFANAAELLRHTDSGWPEENARRCRTWFKQVVYPKIEHYAPFANGNWETAALQTNMAIAVYCNDRELFESTVRYAARGCGNGSIPHLVVNDTGQCQESTRAQHYAQLGLGTLCNAAEIAWNQGVDLYGWKNNRLLKGFTYTAKYGLGNDVPYQHHLDRTGKYGFGGRHLHFTELSTKSRGNFWMLFEQPYNHYANRRNLATPFIKQVVQKKHPEGFSHDYIGLGTLTESRRPQIERDPARSPGIPAGLFGRSSERDSQMNIRLSWVKSVEPTSCRDADSYSVYRASNRNGSFEQVADNVTEPTWQDSDVERGQLYYYRIASKNIVGSSAKPAALAISAGLPGPWRATDVGAVDQPSYTEYDGVRFSLEGEGRDIDRTNDAFHFAYAPMNGQGTVTARIVRPMSSQWTKPGIMMRETLSPKSRHASVLLLPTNWSAALVTRTKGGGETETRGKRSLGEKHVEKENRLMTPYWVRLIRFRNRFTGYVSADGQDWREIGSVEIPMKQSFYVGLPACSQLEDVTTAVTYDSVSIPTWRQTTADRNILAKPEPRWHRPQWFERHEAMNQRVAQGNVDLIMIGDSITHWWDRDGKEVWDKHYGDRAVNLAISGDRTEHVLWRLENGNLEGISPKQAVLMIGTNNHMSSPPEYTANDTRLIIQTIRRKLPKTKVLVLAIFPRGSGPEDGARQINQQVNTLVEKQILADADSMVKFANINDAFFTEPGSQRLNSKAIPDGTHPNAEGYRLWAEAMKPHLEQ